jgi:hypothetical protein
MSSRPSTQGPGNSEDGTRQERRARKLRKKKERIKQHGKGLAQMYKEAVEKRGSEKEKESD